MSTAKAKEGEKAQDTNAWMTTYTDLMILLLTFFVLLLSLSVVTEKKKLLALNSLTGAFGFKPGGHSILGEPKGLNVTIGSSPMVEEDVDFEKMRNLALTNAMEPDVEVVRDQDRIVLSLRNRVLFNHRSTRLKAGASRFLGDLAAILRDGPKRIELRGYAADSETAFAGDPFRESMLLSAERAFVIYRFLAEQGGIGPERMVAHGFGRHGPGSGMGPGREASERQVEIILDYRERIPYRLRKPKSESILDFKGFLFRFPGDAHE